ncbi:MAG: serine/threonine-protein phosphatase [Treponema sp.]|nr:serine/threonine-protein phosphatase [Candidatus Treponema merdequi]
MIYIVLNAVLAAFIIWTSTSVDKKRQEGDAPVVNILLFCAAASVIMFFTVLSVLYGPERLSILLEKTTVFLVSCAFVEMSTIFLNISKSKASAFSKFFKIILILFAAYVCFFKLRMENYKNFIFAFDLAFSGQFAELIPISWIHVFVGLYIFIVPLFGLMIMLLHAENYNSRLLLQKALIAFGSLLFGWIGLTLVYYISDMLPMMRSLFMYIIAVMSIMIANSINQQKIYDGSMIFSSILSLLIKYFVPAAVGAVAYVVLRPLYTENYYLYLVIIFGATFVLMILGRYLSTSMSKMINYRSSQYEVEFESALASIDYESELSDISAEFLKAFRENMQTTTMTMLVDNGSEYATAYDSEKRVYQLPRNSKAREILMNNDIYILFREEVENNYNLQEVKDEIYKVFDETESEVLIILHEGRQVLGLLLLGAKHTGSSYDEYDKTVLDKFYSYLFVFGYYMKNIVNASVVGTVNREIRMSAQIITSIQENMDFIHNPKIDVGYLMVPAHNIGGEFVDLIRLNENRHIFITGAMSGKGISASMSMVIFKSIIRTFLADTHDFKKLIIKLNSFIRNNLPKGTFFSGLFCLMDFATDTMYYINCGIPTLLMYSKTYNNVIEIQGKGYVLGFVKDISPLVKVKQIKLTSGDMLAVSTNGLINSHSLRGETFGKERIKQTIMDNYTYPANRITRFAYDNLQRFMSKELEDDITMLVIRYFGKDGSGYSDELETEQIADHAESFDADALFESAVDETVSEDSVSQNTEQISEPGIVQTDELSAGDFNMVVENPAVDIPDDIADDDMFSADFSNPNEKSADNADIKADDIVDPEVFDGSSLL